ncbi:MAG: BON domain-containing protein [Bryobacteraceae bacterium]
MSTFTRPGQLSLLRRTVPAIVCSAWLVAAGCGGAHSDQTLTTQIQAKLYGDPATKGSNVAVAVHNGVATLSGNVTDPGVALEAMKIANGMVGVKSVQDKLTVNGVAAANRRPDAPAADAAQTQAPPPTQETQPAPPAQRSAPQPAEISIPAGQHIEVRLIDSIDSTRDKPGQTFRATLYAPLVAGGRVVIRAGSPATVVLANAEKAGRIKGRSGLELRVSRIECQGKWYRVDSSFYQAESKSRGKQTAVRTGIGAAAGAVIGALAGGGKGAAIGSAVGGGGGFGVNLLTHGPQVKIPSETVLMFRLKAPLRVAE